MLGDFVHPCTSRRQFNGKCVETRRHGCDGKIFEIRFDIVVFQLADGTIYIKRVIGLPGENVSYQNDQLKINGKVVKEPDLTKNIKVRSLQMHPIRRTSLLTRTDGTIRSFPKIVILYLEIIEEFQR